MPVHLLTDPGDPRVAVFRDLPDAELVRRRGLFVAEGRLVVRRLLESRRFRTRAVLTTAAALEALRDVLDARDRGILDAHARDGIESPALDAVAACTDDLDVFVMSPEDLAAVGGFNFHRGCLALGERPAPATLDDLALDAPGPPVVLALEALANADNVGGLFRNAAAFGARAVLLDTRTCDPLYRKATRTSVGATLTVPFATVGDWSVSLEALRAADYTIVALTPARDAAADIDIAIDIEEAAATLQGRRLALFVGSEGAGLSDTILARADRRVSIAMAPGVDSLNVATATGIALHRLSVVDRRRGTS